MSYSYNKFAKKILIVYIHFAQEKSLNWLYYVTLHVTFAPSHNQRYNIHFTPLGAEEHKTL
jgi:hypothetical protein